MPLGPGDKRRDDSCAYGAVETPPPTMCENRRASPKDAGGLAQASGAMCSATSAAARMSIIGLGGTRSVKRSEEHTSELQSLMRISYAVFCLKTKTTKGEKHNSAIHRLQH